MNFGIFFKKKSRNSLLFKTFILTLQPLFRVCENPNTL